MTASSRKRSSACPSPQPANLRAPSETPKGRSIREELLCKDPTLQYDAVRIRALRAKLKLSQTVMASVLNASVSTIRKWELGDKRPSGPSVKLLSLLDRKGLDVLL